MKSSRIMYFLLVLVSFCYAENLEIRGEMDSNIHYEVNQEIFGGARVRVLEFSYVIPQNFNSLTYRQEIYSFSLRTSWIYLLH